MIFLIKIIFAFIIGSFPTGYVVTKIIKKRDIRKEGSGNIGATNVWRVVGKLPGLFVLMVDILKGYLVVRYLPVWGPLSVSSPSLEEALILGFSVISGHTFSIFLKFKGGKGVATTTGVLFALEPKIFLICIIIWLVIFLFFHYVSLASIVAAITFPFLLVVFAYPFSFILFGILLALLISFKHYPNIRRLVLGEEPKFHL